jgi:ComF family protein
MAAPDRHDRMKLSASRPFTDPLLGFLYPECCQICGEESAKAADGYVCAGCWREVRFIRPPYCARCGLPFLGAVTDKAVCANCHDRELYFDSARAAVVAEGVALDVIHRFKYSQALWFEPFLADLLLREAKPALAGAGWDLVVPVPLHPVKEREREFNQAARIGRRLADALGMPMRTDLVARTEPTRTQTRLDRDERAANVHRAFAPACQADLGGASVVVVDDVLTTGATADAVAKVLRKMGADRVCVWSVARAVLTAPC